MKKVTPVEEWREAIRKHIEKLSEDERMIFAHDIISNIAISVGGTAFEMIGILECVKLDLLEDFKKMADDCKGDCGNCDKTPEK
jgi:hypothetical protein